MASFQPHNTRWLNTVERRLAQARLAEDAGEADSDNTGDSSVTICFDCSWVQLDGDLHSQVQGLIMAIKDPLVLLFVIMAMPQLVGLSFLQYFPT